MIPVGFLERISQDGPIVCTVGRLSRGEQLRKTLRHGTLVIGEIECGIVASLCWDTGSDEDNQELLNFSSHMAMK